MPKKKGPEHIVTLNSTHTHAQSTLFLQSCVERWAKRAIICCEMWSGLNPPDFLNEDVNDG